MQSMLNHTPDSQAREGAAAPSTDNRKPFTQPRVEPLPSLRELTGDIETTFTVQATAGTL